MLKGLTPTWLSNILKVLHKEKMDMAIIPPQIVCVSTFSWGMSARGCLDLENGWSLTMIQKHSGTTFETAGYGSGGTLAYES